MRSTPSMALLLAALVVAAEGRGAFLDTVLVVEPEGEREAQPSDDPAAPCEEFLKTKKNATVYTARACCGLLLASIPAEMRPTVANDPSMWDEAEKLRQQEVCGGPLGSTAAVVEKLNSDYGSFDPSDPSSSLGVAFHAADDVNEAMISELWNVSCGSCSGGISASDGYVALSYLNQKVTAWADDWVGKQWQDNVSSGMYKDIQTCLYPGGQRLGAIISQAGVDAALKCSYAVDAYSTVRPGGCGCTVDTGFDFGCVNTSNWKCEKSKGCNKDPDTGGDITNASRFLHACECQSVSQDPAGNKNGDAACVWLGSERVKAHSAIVQQYDFRKTNLKCWNEFVLDGPVLNNIVKQSPTKFISALVMAWPNCVVDEKCRKQVLGTREYLAQHGSQQRIPIVGLDVYNGSQPFRVLDAKLS